jgi:acyl carrier protein
MDTIEDKVRKIIVSILSVEPSEVTRSALFIDDLWADSLDTIEILMAVEDELSQEVTDEEAEAMVSLGKICDFFETQDTK